MHVKMLPWTLIVQIKTSSSKYVYTFDNALVLGKKAQHHNAIMYSCCINGMHIIRFWSWKRIPTVGFFILLLIIISIHWLWECHCTRLTVNYLQLQAISAMQLFATRTTFNSPRHKPNPLLSDSPKAKHLSRTVQRICSNIYFRASWIFVPMWVLSYL